MPDDPNRTKSAQEMREMYEMEMAPTSRETVVPTTEDEMIAERKRAAEAAMARWSPVEETYAEDDALTAEMAEKAEKAEYARTRPGVSEWSDGTAYGLQSKFLPELRTAEDASGATTHFNHASDYLLALEAAGAITLDEDFRDRVGRHESEYNERTRLDRDISWDRHARENEDYFRGKIQDERGEAVEKATLAEAPGSDPLKSQLPTR